jgi:hypothetical protein
MRAPLYGAWGEGRQGRKVGENAACNNLAPQTKAVTQIKNRAYIIKRSGSPDVCQKRAHDSNKTNDATDKRH